MTPHPNPLDRIRELLDQDPLDETQSGEELDAREDDVFDQALSRLDPLSVSPEAQDLILALTDESASVSPGLRERLVAAGDRALDWRRNEASPLPRLLFLRRQDSHENVDDVADELGVDPNLLEDVEKGARDIQQLAAEDVAAWVRHFDVSPDLARRALRLVITMQQRSNLAAAAASNVEAEHDKFFQDVMRHLEGNAST